MTDLSPYEDDLIRQRLHMDAVYESLTQMRSQSMPTAERDRYLTYAIERFAEYRELVERMLRDLDRPAA